MFGQFAEPNTGAGDLAQLVGFTGNTYLVSLEQNPLSPWVWDPFIILFSFGEGGSRSKPSHFYAIRRTPACWLRDLTTYSDLVAVGHFLAEPNAGWGGLPPLAFIRATSLLSPTHAIGCVCKFRAQWHGVPHRASPKPKT